MACQNVNATSPLDAHIPLGISVVVDREQRGEISSKHREDKHKRMEGLQQEIQCAAIALEFEEEASIELLKQGSRLKVLKLTKEQREE